MNLLFCDTPLFDGYAVDSQGGWEADETVEAAAARETVEEAGVRGSLEVSDVSNSGPCHGICSYTTACARCLSLRALQSGGQSSNP